MKIIEVETKQKNILYGCLYGEQFSDTCLIVTNGTGGNVFENRFLRELGEYLQSKNISYIYAHNSGAFQMMDNYGLSFEKFDNCVDDISAFVDFATRQGYKKIILGGHSLGCNKVIYYMSQVKPNNIQKLILISPVDMKRKTEGEANSIKVIDEYLKENPSIKPQDIIPILYDGYNYYCKESFIDMKCNQNQNNLPIYSKNKDFSQLQSIHLPIYMIMGEKDAFSYNDTQAHLEIIKNNSLNDNITYDVIENTGHTFKNKIAEFCDKIYDNL